MIVYGNPAATFDGLARFGATVEVFPGGPGFVGGDDQAIFTGTNQGFLQGAASLGYYYTPPTSAFLSSVGRKWADLKNSESPADQQFLESTQSRLGTLLNSFQLAVANHSAFGYSQDAQKQVIARANDLKRLLNEIVQYKMQPVTVVSDVGVVSPPPRTVIGAGGASTIGPMSTAPVSGGGWIMPVAIGAGVLVVGGLIFALTRRKKTQMSGYHRRSRRIRR